MSKSDKVKLNLYKITYNYNYKDHVVHTSAEDFGHAHRKFNEHFTVRKAKNIELVAEGMDEYNHSGFLC